MQADRARYSAAAAIAAVTPLIRVNSPAVVVQMSPSTGEVGAVPCGARKDDRLVLAAGPTKVPLDDVVPIPLGVSAMPMLSLKPAAPNSAVVSVAACAVYDPET